MSRTQLIVLISGGVLLILVLEMVRRRRLREEYSWLWLLTALIYLLVAAWPEMALWMAGVIGLTRTSSAFVFLGLLFLFLISIQFSVQISRLTEQNKNMAQQIAILDSELRAARPLTGARGEKSSETPPAPPDAEGSSKSAAAGD